MQKMNNPVGWFEIPVTDMERAITFYQNTLGLSFNRLTLEELDMATMAFDGNAVGISGALVKNEKFYKPGFDSGVVIYFNCQDIGEALQLAQLHGGEVIVPKRQISPEHGYMAVMRDSEGNRIALHANQ